MPRQPAGTDTTAHDILDLAGMHDVSLSRGSLVRFWVSETQYVEVRVHKAERRDEGDFVDVSTDGMLVLEPTASNRIRVKVRR